MKTALWFVALWTLVEAEFFTSSGHLKSLVAIENELAVSLRAYAVREERRLEELKSIRDRFEKFTDRLAAVGTVSHPVTTYRTIKTLKNGGSAGNAIAKISKKNNEIMKKLNKYKNRFPSNVDVEGAIEALLRLQETFQLTPQEIIQGIQADTYFTKLGIDDTLDLGIHAFDQSKLSQSKHWLREARRMMKLSAHGVSTKKHFEALDHLAWTEYVDRDFEAAYNVTEEMLILDPVNKRTKDNLKAFRRLMLKEQGNNKTTRKVTLKKKQKRKNYPKLYYLPDDKTDYYAIEYKRAQELCRGETDPLPKRVRAKLHCWLKRDHPLLVLKPALVERLYTKPDIRLFREMITDREIERIKNISTPLLARATVHNPSTGKTEFASYRISKSAWLDTSDDSLVEKLNRRTEAYTGLNMETAESLQVANYGIGGHYDTHFDFSRATPLAPPPWKNRTEYTWRPNVDKMQRFKGNGNRIATLLLYMSDVEKGGSTVFTNIGQAVRPEKRSAIFWYNLNHDGTGDLLTRHAACPVLIGEKWVSNRWIHERGQEFRRSCRLKLEDD